jgi:hypothetical protein
MNNIFDTSRCQVNQTPLHLKFLIISNLLCIPFLCSFFQILSFLLSKPGHLADQERTLSLKDVPQVLASSFDIYHRESLIFFSSLFSASLFQ